MISINTFNIFRRGSRTYFYSSLLLPGDIRDDVFVLYSFVRTADDFVDSIPQQKKEFKKFKTECINALNWKKTSHPVLKPFMALLKKRGFKKEWVISFLSAMEQDLQKKQYHNISEVEEYMYGSAEVIGLMMASIMGLPKQAFPYAKMLGRSMQFINFVRDIEEDLTLGRVYLPGDELKQSGLKNLNFSYTFKHPELFRSFIFKQISHYRKWQEQAEPGYVYIPKRYLRAIKTAADLYKRTGVEIEKDPFVVYRKKVRPSYFNIAYTAGKNTFL